MKFFLAENSLKKIPELINFSGGISIAFVDVHPNQINNLIVRHIQPFCHNDLMDTKKIGDLIKDFHQCSFLCSTKGYLLPKGDAFPKTQSQEARTAGFEEYAPIIRKIIIIQQTISIFKVIKFDLSF